MYTKSAVFFLVLSSLVFSAEDGQPIREVSSVEVRANGSVKVSPDPDSAWEMLAGLYSQRVLQEYLSITEQERAAIQHACVLCKQLERDFVRSHDGTTNLAEDLIEFRARVAKPLLEEVIPHEKYLMLRKLVMRLEVVRVGLPESLVRGQLGFKIGVHEGQKSELLRKAVEIQQNANERIAAILKQAESDTLGLLPPEQRRKAEELIGGTIDLREMSEHEALYEHALNETGALDERSSESK